MVGSMYGPMVEDTVEDKVGQLELSMKPALLLIKIFKMVVSAMFIGSS